MATLTRTPKGRVKAHIFESLGYSPSPIQAEAHFSSARIKLVAGGERGGKSLWAAMELVGDWANGQLYWLVGADYEQCRPEFSYIMDNLGKLKVISNVSYPKEGSLRLVLGTGAEIVTRSAKEPEKLGGAAPDGILICEVGLLSYEAFLRVRGRLAEKRGWLAMSGSFESSLGYFPELYTRWQIDNPDEARSFSLPSWENRVIYPGGRDDPEILALERMYPHDRFQERFAGVPCPPSGLVLKEFRVTLHCGDYQFDPNEPVYLWVDPGYAGAYAVEVAQIKADAVYIIDEIYERGLTTEEIIEVCQVKPWWYKVSGGAIDIAGRQHQAMPSAEEVWRVKGKVALDSRKIGIIDGIDRLRTFLKPNPITGKPNFFVNYKCRGLIAEMGGGVSPIEGMGMWRYKTDRTGAIISEVPEDKNNHSVKAVIYGLCSHFGLVGGRSTKTEVRSLG